MDVIRRHWEFGKMSVPESGTTGIAEGQLSLDIGSFRLHHGGRSCLQPSPIPPYPLARREGGGGGGGGALPPPAPPNPTIVRSILIVFPNLPISQPAYGPVVLMYSNLNPL